MRSVRRSSVAREIVKVRQVLRYAVAAGLVAQSHRFQFFGGVTTHRSVQTILAKSVSSPNHIHTPAREDIVAICAVPSLSESEDADIVG